MKSHPTAHAPDETKVIPGVPLRFDVGEPLYLVFDELFR